MIVETERYTRKPVHVDAIQVTEENIETLALWCQGNLINDGDGDYIKVDVHTPRNERQTQAFVGDWLLYHDKGFKVYTDEAFRKTFVKGIDLGTSR